MLVHDSALLESRIENGDVVFTNDDFIFYSKDSSALIERISSYNPVLLFTNFKRSLPPFLSKHPATVRVLSEKINNKELFFHLDSIQQYLPDSSPGYTSGDDKYREAIIKIQNYLFGKGIRNTAIEDALEVVGQTCSADSVWLFENRSDSHGRYLMTLVREWKKDGVTPQIDNPLLKLLPYHPNFSRWENELSVGKIVRGNISGLPQSEKPLMSTLKVENLLIFPVIIKEMFWGFIMIAGSEENFFTVENEAVLIRRTVEPIVSYLENQVENSGAQEPEENLQRLFESSFIGLVVTTKNWTLTSCNPAFANMLGYKIKELQNLNLKNITHPDDFGREIPMMKDLFTGKISSYFIEKRFLKKNGNPVYVKMNVSAYGFSNDGPQMILGLIEDITARKEAERALYESESRYRTLSELALEGIMIHKNGIAIDCNERLLKELQYTREELIGKNIVEIAIDERYKDLVYARMKEDDILPYEIVAKRKDGKRIPVEVETRIAEFKGEKVRVTVVRDLTRWKKQEAELRKLNTAIEKNMASVVITDKDGNIEYVNKAFCEVTGYSFEEAIGQNPRILKSDYYSNDFYKELWETIKEGKTWTGIFRNKTKKGDLYWEKAVISPIIDEHGDITHFLALKENITEEVNTQEALKISEGRHRLISELTNDFIYSAEIQDDKLKFGWSSGSLDKLSGYSLEEINAMEKGWFSIVDKDDLRHKLITRLKRLSRGKVIGVEYRIKTKKKKTVWISEKIRLTRSEDGEKGKEIMGAMVNITESKNAQLSLEENRRFLDKIIENLPLGLQIYDEKGIAIRMNEANRKLMGLKSKDIGIGSYNILKDPLPRSTGITEVFKKVYESKKTIRREEIVDFKMMGNKWDLRKDEVAFEEIIFPILKEDGTIQSVIALFNNITDRLKAERALRASERHQKALLQVIPDLIFVLTDDGFFKDVYTDSVDRLFLPPENYVGKSWAEIFPKEQSKKFYYHLEKAKATGDVQIYNYEIDINGLKLYYETRLLISEEKEVIAIVRDITDNKLYELALKESEEKFRELAEKTQDALVLLSAQNKVLYVSPNFEKILGVKKQDYIRNPSKLLSLIHKDDSRWVIKEVSRYRKEKRESLDIQFRVMHGIEKTKWIWYRESTIFDDDRQPVRYAVVISDITSRKESELALQKAKEEAEKTNKSKSAFLANISHEIRTPMNAVLGFTDLLLSRITDPVLKGYLNSIKSSGNTLLNLLNDILDLSKIEARKMELKLSPVDLKAAFHEVGHIFSLKAKEKGLGYHFEIDKDMPDVLMMDELRLKQILLNLVDNAVKFTEEGQIKVSARRIDDDRNEKYATILITVQDTGIGIPAHLHDIVFESFRQQDDQDKKKYKGTGLGLAITKRLVELMGGKIDLESQPGRGSKFKVTFQNIEISKAVVKSVESLPAGTLHEETLLREKIIVVADEQTSNRKLIREIFNNTGAVILESGTIECLNTEFEGSASLIIAEVVNKKQVDKIIKFIKQHENLKQAAMIGITSYPDLKAEVFDSHDFISILTKPINLNELVEVIKNYFKPMEVGGYSMKEFGLMDKERLDEVLKELGGTLSDQWRSAMKTSSFGKVEEFALNLKTTGLKFNIEMLKSYSDRLVLHAKNFDIDNMNELLHSFSDIVERIKDIRKQMKDG